MGDDVLIQLLTPSARVGGELRGSVTVRSRSPIKAKGLRLSLKAVMSGEGECVVEELEGWEYGSKEVLGKRGFSSVIYEVSDELVKGDVPPGEHPFTLRIPLDAPPTLRGKQVSVSWIVEAVVDRRFRRDIKASAQAFIYPPAPRPEPTTVSARSGGLMVDVVLPATALTPGFPALLTVAVGSPKPVECREVAAVLKYVENAVHTEPGLEQNQRIRCLLNYSVILAREVIARDVTLSPHSPITHQIPVDAPGTPSVETDSLKAGLVLEVACSKKGFLKGSESVEVLIPTTPG